MQSYSTYVLPVYGTKVVFSGGRGKAYPHNREEI